MANGLSKTQATIIGMRFDLQKNFNSGDKFYSRNEAAERYGVSHCTSFVAMQTLISDGLLESISTVGYFVK